MHYTFIPGGGQRGIPVGKVVRAALHGGGHALRGQQLLEIVEHAEISQLLAGLRAVRRDGHDAHEAGAAHGFDDRPHRRALRTGRVAFGITGRVEKEKRVALAQNRPQRFGVTDVRHDGVRLRAFPRSELVLGMNDREDWLALV